MPLNVIATVHAVKRRNNSNNTKIITIRDGNWANAENKLQ